MIRNLATESMQQPNYQQKQDELSLAQKFIYQIKNCSCDAALQIKVSQSLLIFLEKEEKKTGFWQIIKEELQNLSEAFQPIPTISLSESLFLENNLIWAVQQHFPSVIQILFTLLCTSSSIDVQEQVCYCLYNYLEATGDFQIFQSYHFNNKFFGDVLLACSAIEVSEIDQQLLEDFLTILIEFVDLYVEKSKTGNGFYRHEDVLNFYNEIFLKKSDLLSVQARQASLSSVYAILSLVSEDSSSFCEFLDSYYPVIFQFMHTEKYFTGFADEEQKKGSLWIIGAMLESLSGVEGNQAINLIKSGVLRVVEELMDSRTGEAGLQLALKAVGILHSLADYAGEDGIKRMIDYESEKTPQNKNAIVKKLWEYMSSKAQSQDLIQAAELAFQSLLANGSLDSGKQLLEIVKTLATSGQ